MQSQDSASTILHDLLLISPLSLQENTADNMNSCKVRHAKCVGLPCSWRVSKSVRVCMCVCVCVILEADSSHQGLLYIW